MVLKSLVRKAPGFFCIKNSRSPLKGVCCVKYVVTFRMHSKNVK